MKLILRLTSLAVAPGGTGSGAASMPKGAIGEPEIVVVGAAHLWKTEAKRRGQEITVTCTNLATAPRQFVASIVAEVPDPPMPEKKPETAALTERPGAPEEAPVRKKPLFSRFGGLARALALSRRRMP